VETQDLFLLFVNTISFKIEAEQRFFEPSEGEAGAGMTEINVSCAALSARASEFPDIRSSAPPSIMQLSTLSMAISSILQRQIGNHRRTTQFRLLLSRFWANIPQ
jgi:hypothetical protein